MYVYIYICIYRQLEVADLGAGVRPQGRGEAAAGACDQQAGA